MRLVDADALHINITCGRMNGKKEFADAVKAMINHAPTVEAEPVRHGRWIKIGDFDPIVKKYYFRVKCSECNAYFAEDWEHKRSIRNVMSYRYCPKCGAKMDGEK